jgi:hypothetical protein
MPTTRIRTPKPAGAWKATRQTPPGRITRARIVVAAEAGASVWKLAEVSRHKGLDTLRGYVRRVDLFKEHAGAAFL